MLFIEPVNIQELGVYTHPFVSLNVFVSCHCQVLILMVDDAISQASLPCKVIASKFCLLSAWQFPERVVILLLHADEEARTKAVEDIRQYMALDRDNRRQHMNVRAAFFHLLASLSVLDIACMVHICSI